MNAISARKIGVIGFGAIGQSVVKLLSDNADVSLGILTRSQIDENALPARARCFTHLDALLAWAPDTIIEAASVAAFRETVPVCLDSKIDVIAASVGALEDVALIDRIIGINTAGGGRLTIPAGAVGGLDYIFAAALAPETRVTYTSRKPPAAWTAELAERGLRDRALTEKVVLFQGGAREAAALYPRNMNAGLTIALAAGFDCTIVKVVSDPSVHQNTHEIDVNGPNGQAKMRFFNTPDAKNPKTSAITAFSLASAALRRGLAMQ